jgi:acetyl-CoA carboxylase carboxyltransferase component
MFGGNHMQAQTADEKAEATEQAVDRVRLTLEWLQGQKAMTPMQVEHWDHLVRVLALCDHCC